MKLAILAYILSLTHAHEAGIRSSPMTFPSEDHILCPGQPSENYCDCHGDCLDNPEWCGCDEAKTCCDIENNSTYTNSDDHILCPGQPPENYCDGDSDCINNPDWCSCDEAKARCKKHDENTVTCPRQPAENYCDCNGDCINNPEWCSCDEAKACCDGKTVPYPISEYHELCPGQPPENYCDCDSDCIDTPEWCSCLGAKICCKGAHSSTVTQSNYLTSESRSKTIKKKKSAKKSAPVPKHHEVLCPGQPTENYCDCEGDCFAFPEWCSCEKAKACCDGARDVVTCPGQPRENYCDCDGDCIDNPDWCSCDEAKHCCNNI